jgi:uncharacterized protein
MTKPTRAVRPPNTEASETQGLPVMRLLSSFFVLSLLVMSGAQVAAGPVRAEPPAPAPAEACKGKDMLAGYAASDPDLYAKVMDAARSLENSEALLWKIEKHGLASSYLFGTVHLSDPRVSAVPDKVKAALATVKGLVVEVADLSDAAMAKAMTDSAPLLMYTGGQTLADQLTDDEFKQVSALIAKSGLPGEVAAIMKPWIVNMLLSVSDCERKAQAGGTKVLDMRLVDEAKARGLPVSGLETIEQQLASLAEVPEDQQIMMLKSGLKFADRTDDMMETLIQLYLKRQAGAAMPFQLALAAKSGAPATAYDGLTKSLLTDRNIRMRDAMMPLIGKGPMFVAVGALHLPGKDGIVALLKEAGYTLTPAE